MQLFLLAFMYALGKEVKRKNKHKKGGQKVKGRGGRRIQDKMQKL